MQQLEYGYHIADQCKSSVACLCSTNRLVAMVVEKDMSITTLRAVSERLKVQDRVFMTNLLRADCLQLFSLKIVMYRWPDLRQQSSCY